MRITIQQAFATLGVSSDATSDQVRQAYRKLALQFHPDKNPDPTATEKFQQLSAAYKRICDHHSRRRAGSGASSNNRRHGFHGFADSEGGEFEDLYGDDDDELDEMDLSFEEMLMVFQMMFGHTTHGRKKKTSKTTKKQMPVHSHAKNDKRLHVRVPRRGGGRGNQSQRRAPLGRGGFADSFLFGSAEEMMFASFMSMGVNDLDSDLKSMSSFFESSFGGDMDSDFSLSSGDNESDDDDVVCNANETDKPATASKEKVSTTGESHKELSPDSQGAGERTKRSDGSEPEKVAAESQVEASSIELDTHVRVFGKHSGVVKFKGPVHYAKGDFVGVCLSEPQGKNDGTVKGVSYFECPPRCGLMVRPEDVVIAARH